MTTGPVHAVLDRRRFLGVAGAGVLAGGLIAPRVFASTARPLNVLLIMVDDLRPELGCYGRAHMRTPNIDALARRGVLFERAYCQMAICGASRTSMLTGLRPDTSGVLWNEQDFRETLPDHPSLPAHLRAGGLETSTLGKIYHHAETDRAAWSRRVPFEWPGTLYALPENRKYGRQRQAEARERGLRGRDRMRFVQGPLTEAADVADDAYIDGMVASAVCNDLRARSRENQAWLMAVGFLRPHLPFACPKRYWDLYDRDEIDLPAHRTPDAGIPAAALHDSKELTSYPDAPETVSPHEPLAEDLSRRLIHGYYASTSYVDALVGKLMRTLDETGQADRTVVVLVGDHGFHLGDRGLWCKHSTFENATRSPLICAGPGIAPGARSEALVEFVDVFPTMCDAAGVSTPVGLDGRSFASVLENPDTSHKDAAFSQYPRPGLMGYSMRTDRYRYTRWAARERHAEAAHADHLEPAVELYDHINDPDELTNLATREQWRDVSADLDHRLRAGSRSWRPALVQHSNDRSGRARAHHSHTAPTESVHA